MSYDKCFSVLGYKKMISNFIEAGYKIKDFNNHNSSKKHLILRHDVDISLDYAEILAKIEMKENLKATYFILMTSDLYNPFSERSKNSIKRIIKYGHNIGLHFDPTKYKNNKYEEAISNEKIKLELITNSKVNMFSFHRPGNNIKNLKNINSKMTHTYMPKFIKDIGYCSDSRGGWHYGHPLQNPFFLKGKAMQLLTHPIWWIAEGANAVQKLRYFRKENTLIIDNEIRENCDIYK